MKKGKPIDLMHHFFGEGGTERCATCCNLKVYQCGSKSVRKCIAYGGLHSSKADWAKYWSACGLYGTPVPYQAVSDTAKRTFARIGIYRDDTTQLDGQMRLEALKDADD